MSAEQYDAHVRDWDRNNLVLEIERLRAALRAIIDHAYATDQSEETRINDMHDAAVAALKESTDG